MSALRDAAFPSQNVNYKWDMSRVEFRRKDCTYEERVLGGTRIIISLGGGVGGADGPRIIDYT